MVYMRFRKCLAVLIGLALAATGLWAAGEEEGSTAAAVDKQYVTDPTTGKVVTAPEYGGTITLAAVEEQMSSDTAESGPNGSGMVGGVVEKLAFADWATPRDEFDFQFLNVPANTRGQLAESWSQPDPLTFVINVRQGVHWHDKAPMNGRELIADDIAFNFHRVFGMGSGFTEASEWLQDWAGVEFESITATDQWTVEFKLKQLSLTALRLVLDHWISNIYPPEVLQEHGDMLDWRNLVGTGPYEATEWVGASSETYTKNPDYWGFDEKYPENRLPYADEIRVLIMPEVATMLSAVRTGKVDRGYTLRTIDQVEGLERTNPELEIWPIYGRADYMFGMDNINPPFDDIRVRKAMQMALNLEEINSAYFGGYADMIPQGLLNRLMTEVVFQFEEWPEDVKKVFDYDPEGAEALLDVAGYPRGADGTRFTVEFMHLNRYSTSWPELVGSYWKKIGVDIEIEVLPINPWVARSRAKDFQIKNLSGAAKWHPMPYLSGQLTEAGFYGSVNADPDYDAMSEAAGAATTTEEQNRIYRQMNQHVIENFYAIWAGNAPTYQVTQPWLKGYNGENWMGNGQRLPVIARLWIDQDLKKEMGF